MDYFILHIYLPYSLFRLVWLVSGVHDFYIYTIPSLKGMYL